MARYGVGQIAAAVGWWRAALVRPKYDALGSERDSAMEMAQVMMSAYGDRLTDAQLDAFAVHLAEVLAGHCEHTWKAYGGAEYPICRDRILSVDYDPDVVLRHCGEVAGFSRAFFWPIKTTMWLDDDGAVKVRHGYGGDVVTIRAADSAPVRVGSDET